jgi:hypothetical protein
MKKTMILAAFCLVLFASVAGAYEYPLQFTPNPGYRGLTVAGYQFQGADVVGVCSYFTVSGGSGKGGGGGRAVKYYNQTCTWDLHGNLLSVTAGAPVAPHPLYTTGTQTVYAVDANGNLTGFDTKLSAGGFISSLGGHYTWLTPMSNAVLHDVVYSIAATLKSDGDVPIDISAVMPGALHGVATLKGTTCIGQIKVDATCTINVSYDPTKLPPTANGLTYDTLRIDLTSDAAASHDFIQNLTIVLPSKDSDN